MGNWQSLITILTFLILLLKPISRSIIRRLYLRKRRIDGAIDLVSCEQHYDFQLKKLLEKKELGKADCVEDFWLQIVLFLEVFQ